MLDLFIQFLFFTLNHLHILHFCPLTFLQHFLKLDFIFYWWFIVILSASGVQIFTILNEECTCVNFLLISVYFFPLIFRFIFLGILSLFSSFLVFLVPFFLVVLFFKPESFPLLFLDLPFFCFFCFDIFGPRNVFDFLLFVLIILDFCILLLLKLSKLIPYIDYLLFKLLSFLK